MLVGRVKVLTFDLPESVTDCGKVEKVVSYLKQPFLRSIASAFCSDLIRGTVTTTTTRTSVAFSTKEVRFTTPTTTIVSTSVVTSTVAETSSFQLPNAVVSTYVLSSGRDRSSIYASDTTPDMLSRP
jgi:hypothetical protein